MKSPAKKKKDKKDDKSVMFKKTVTYKNIEYDIEVVHMTPILLSKLYNCEMYIDNYYTGIFNAGFLYDLITLKKTIESEIKRYVDQKKRKDEVKNWCGKL